MIETLAQVAGPNAVPEFLPDWHRVPPTLVHRSEYVRNEIARLARENKAVLRSVLTSDEWAQQLALPLLAKPEIAAEILGGYSPWLLRLVAGAVPIDWDADGRILADELRGKVLRCKVLTKGGDVKDRLGGVSEVPSEISRQYSGPMRTARQSRGESLYVHVDVGSQPVAVSFHDAVTILRKWGYGIPERRYRRRERTIEVRNSETGVVQYVRQDEQIDHWMVEEVTPKMLADESVATAMAFATAEAAQKQKA